MRKIKWGVIGTAYICDWCTLPGMRLANNCEMVAIAGRSKEKAEQFKEKFGFKKAYGSYDALLADPEVEAVYIALPNDLHREWTIKALNHGKHVLCEKPIAPTEADARAMFEAAEANHVYLMEAFAYLHSPYIAAIRAEIEKGTIGDVCYMDSAFITSDYDVSNIRMRRETFGGCTYDLGVYSSSLTLRLLAEEPARVRAIAGFSKEGVDHLTTVLMEFADGKRAGFTCGIALATNKGQRIDRLEIHGAKGSIIGTKFRFNLDGELAYKVVSMDGQEEVKTVSVPHNYALEVEQMGRCIADGEAPAVSREFSLANARIVDRILKEIGY